MWEAVAKVLTNSNALLVLIFLMIFTLILIVLAASGLVQINTGSFKMGADSRERDIIRQQTDWSHTYILGLKSQIVADEKVHNGYLTLYMLESTYDEVVKWIVFNHINLESDYVSIKQEQIKSMIHSQPDIQSQYKTKEFDKKVDKWVEELITRLVKIRKVYK